MKKIKNEVATKKKKVVAKKKGSIKGKMVAKKTLRLRSGQGKKVVKKSIVEMSKEKFDYFMAKIAAI